MNSANSLEPVAPHQCHCQAPHDLSPEQFRALGRQVVDEISDFLASLPGRPVAPGEAPAQVRALLGDRPLPAGGAPAAELLRDAADLLFEHSVFNSHPRFWGYISSSGKISAKRRNHVLKIETE